MINRKIISALISSLFVFGLTLSSHATATFTAEEATNIMVAVGVVDRVDRRMDHRDNAGDRVDDKQEYREERRDCTGDGPDCRSDNRQDKRGDTVDRADERIDDRQDRR